jgi:hypothetical protein
MLRLYKEIKSLIPKWWKYPLWWIFKSPQREFGWSTLIQDLSALAAFCFYSLFRFKKLKQISICVGIYNRSEIFMNGLNFQFLIAEVMMLKILNWRYLKNGMAILFSIKRN